MFYTTACTLLFAIHFFLEGHAFDDWLWRIMRRTILWQLGSLFQLNWFMTRPSEGQIIALPYNIIQSCIFLCPCLTLCWFCLWKSEVPTPLRQACSHSIPFLHFCPTSHCPKFEHFAKHVIFSKQDDHGSNLWWSFSNIWLYIYKFLWIMTLERMGPYQFIIWTGDGNAFAALLGHISTLVKMQQESDLGFGCFGYPP